MIQLTQTLITLSLKVTRSMYLLGVESRITLNLFTIDLHVWETKTYVVTETTPTHRTGESASNMAVRS